MDTIPSNAQDSSQSMTRREREKLAHRQEIIDAATRVFAQKGFSNATLDEVAQEAEFSKGALYLYFSSKEDLLFSIIKEKFEPLLEALTALLNGASSFREELHGMFSYLADMSFREKEFFSLILSQQIACFKAFSEERAVECFAIRNAFDTFFINRINNAIRDGELRKIDPRAIHGVLYGASENMMFNQWNCKNIEDLQKAVDVFIDILYNGIVQEKEA